MGVRGTSLCRDPRSSRKPMPALPNTHLQSDSPEESEFQYSGWDA